MDPLEELERMALNIESQPDGVSAEDIAIDLEGWQNLFSYSYDQAADLIEKQRDDFTRRRLSDEEWEMVREKLESQGFDRSAYEHELSVCGKRKSPSSRILSTVKLSLREARAVYVVRLEGPLSTPDDIQRAAGMATKPDLFKGDSNEGNATFCCVNGTGKQAIIESLAAQSTSFTPTFARILQKANKELSFTSIFPTLGIESTLPQHRSNEVNTIFKPGQEEYPVWYFFYGTLADTAILTRTLCLSKNEVPQLLPATVRDGKIETWGGKYKALVNTLPGTGHVHGSAYKVMLREHEDALRIYETENYEVVRCAIQIGSDVIQGCTFRFVGS